MDNLKTIHMVLAAEISDGYLFWGIGNLGVKLSGKAGFEIFIYPIDQLHLVLL